MNVQHIVLRELSDRRRLIRRCNNPCAVIPEPKELGPIVLPLDDIPCLTGRLVCGTTTRKPCPFTALKVRHERREWTRTGLAHVTPDSLCVFASEQVLRIAEGAHGEREGTDVSTDVFRVLARA
jgi:hypothetical protein